MTRKNLARLKGKMTEFGYSVESLSKALGISHTSLTKRLRGDLPFRLNEIQIMIKIFELTNREILQIFFDIELA